METRSSSHSLLQGDGLTRAHVRCFACPFGQFALRRLLQQDDRAVVRGFLNSAGSVSTHCPAPTRLLVSTMIFVALSC